MSAYSRHLALATLVSAAFLTASLSGPTTRAADTPAIATTAKAPTLDEQVKNLQSKDAAQRDQATESLVRHAAASDDNKNAILDKLDAVKDALGQFRASYVTAQIRGRVNGVKGNAEAQAAMLAAVHFLDDHLDADPIRKFSPESGFTHMAANHNDGLWNLILERAGSAAETGRGPLRGITLTYDPQKKRIIKITNWEPKVEHVVAEPAK